MSGANEPDEPDREPTEDELHDRFVIDGDPEEALRTFLDAPANHDITAT